MCCTGVIRLWETWFSFHKTLKKQVISMLAHIDKRCQSRRLEYLLLGFINYSLQSLLVGSINNCDWSAIHLTSMQLMPLFERSFTAAWITATECLLTYPSRNASGCSQFWKLLLVLSFKCRDVRAWPILYEADGSVLVTKLCVLVQTWGHWWLPAQPPALSWYSFNRQD